MHRDALFLQHPLKNLIPAGGCPQQDHDITVADLAQGHALRSPLRNPEGAQQFLDLRRNAIGLLLLDRKLIRPVTGLKQQQLRVVLPLALRLRVVRAQMQRRLIVVHDASHGFSHQVDKYAVGALEHLPPAAEILVQIDLFCRLFALSLRLRVLLVFFQKQLRPRQTELINTLLHIADHKPVVSALALAGDGGQKILLHQIAVLILVDHDLVEKGTVLKRRLRRSGLSILRPSHQH